MRSGVVPSRHKKVKEWAGGNRWGEGGSEEYFQDGRHDPMREEMKKRRSEKACHLDHKQVGLPERVRGSEGRRDEGFVRENSQRKVLKDHDHLSGKHLALAIPGNVHLTGNATPYPGSLAWSQMAGPGHGLDAPQGLAKSPSAISSGILRMLPQPPPPGASGLSHRRHRKGVCSAITSPPTFEGKGGNQPPAWTPQTVNPNLPVQARSPNLVSTLFCLFQGFLAASTHHPGYQKQGQRSDDSECTCVRPTALKGN